MKTVRVIRTLVLAGMVAMIIGLMVPPTSAGPRQDDCDRRAASRVPPPGHPRCVDGEPVLCDLSVSNAQHVGDKVQSTTSIVCTEEVFAIWVRASVTRTRADGHVSWSGIESKNCVDKKVCNVTAKMDWVSAPNDLWHGWGDGGVTFHDGENICTFNGNFVHPILGTAWFRSKDCRQLGRCSL